MGGGGERERERERWWERERERGEREREGWEEENVKDKKPDLEHLTSYQVYRITSGRGRGGGEKYRGVGGGGEEGENIKDKKIRYIKHNKLLETNKTLCTLVCLPCEKKEKRRWQTELRESLANDERCIIVFVVVFVLLLLLFWGAGIYQMEGAATSIIFVATNMCLSRQNASFVSTNVHLFVAIKYFCRDKTFVTTNICRVLATNHIHCRNKVCCRDLLSQQTRVCRDENDACGRSSQ